jgi:cell division protein FtsB
MLDPISAELKRLNAHIAELEAENARLRERVKALESNLSEVVNDPRFLSGRIVKP